MPLLDLVCIEFVLRIEIDWTLEDDVVGRIGANWGGGIKAESGREWDCEGGTKADLEMTDGELDFGDGEVKEVDEIVVVGAGPRRDGWLVEWR